MSGIDGLSEFGWTSAAMELHQRETIPAILSLLPAAKPLYILDVGCGNGYLANQLFKMGHHVLGIDIAEDGIQIACETYPHLRFEVRSAYQKLTDLPGMPADVIISSEVIEHLYYPQQFLRNMYVNLIPGGSLILTTPYHGYLKNLALSLFNGWDRHHHPQREGGHIKFFSETSLSQVLASNGFTRIEFRNVGRVPFLWKSMVCRAQREAAVEK